MSKTVSTAVLVQRIVRKLHSREITPSEAREASSHFTAQEAGQIFRAAIAIEQKGRTAIDR